MNSRRAAEIAEIAAIVATLASGATAAAQDAERVTPGRHGPAVAMAPSEVPRAAPLKAFRPTPSPVTISSGDGAASSGSIEGPIGGAAPSLRVSPESDKADAPPAAATPPRVPIALASARVPSQGTRPTSWWAPAASALLPGAGQFTLGQDRSVGYFAVEIYGWVRFAADLREANKERRGYEQLAATVARAFFSELKPNGDFAYYERMETFVESGVFDASADEGTQPETNGETFNGSLWLRARSTFWDDPADPPPSDSDEFIAAVRYYEERAIRPEFRWSWRNAQLEQDLFRRTIDRSNDAYRRSLQDLGVILANHVLSTVDAYVTLRIRRMATQGRLGVQGSVAWAPDLGFGSGRGEPR